MKKMTKFGKTVLLSTLAALAFGGVAAGTTYALFTSDAKTDVSVTTGKVLVEKTVSLEGGETLDDGEVVAAEAKGNTITFGCGGTAVIDEKGDVKLTNIVAGDKVTVKVHALNKSNVNIKYRALVTTDGDFADLVSLSGTANGEAMKPCKGGLFTTYAAADTATESLGDYELTFGIDKDTKVTDGTVKSGTVSIKIQAIQGNAKVEDEVEYRVTKTADELITALADAEEGSTVEIASDTELKETVEVDKDLNIVLASNLTAPKGESAIVVKDGSTLTLDGETITSGSTKGRIKRANDVSMPTITSTDTAIRVDGGKAVINGVKVVSTGYGAVSVKNKGELVINGGEFLAPEYGALAEYAGNLTINGGTFTTTDNFVVGTNGTSGHGKNVITINGGTFNGHIKSKGYIGCGVYVANDDTVKINAGEFNIYNGCGVLARSGNTTVADGVKFNFTNDVDGIKEGWVGDKNALVPVNARIVKDLSKESYPGGVPTVTGSNVLDMLKTDGKTYFVNSEDTLQAAVADTTNETKYIFVEDDIDLASKVDIINKDTVIYGDGSKLKFASDSRDRVITLYGDDHPVLNGGSFGLVGVDAIKTNKEGTGIYIGDDNQAIFTYGLSDFSITIDSASLLAKYALDIGNHCDSITVSARHSTITGYSAFDTWVDNTTATFEDCKLVGENTNSGDDDTYATIVLVGDTENTNLTFKNTEIAVTKTGTADEYFLDARDNTTGSATFDENCTFTVNGETSSLNDNLHIHKTSTFKVL